MAIKMEDYSWKFTDDREWRDHFRSWPPVIISCAITGGLQGKDANPNLPESPEEQADSTYAAYKAGASSIHIHSRDPKTKYASLGQAEDFYKSNKLIRARCPDVIINDTGYTAFSLSQEEMTKFFKAIDSEMATLDVGVFSMVIPMKATADKVPALQANAKILGGSFTFDPAKGRGYLETIMNVGYGACERVAIAMKAANTKPEFEVFNSSSWWYVDHTIATGNVKEPYWCQLVFGQEGACSLPTPMQALEMIRQMPPKSFFSSIGIGPLQLPITTLALILGGHLRVGMEDNVYYRRGELAKSNAQFVERAVRICHELNREVATPAQAREMLGLSQTPKQYP